MMQVVAKVTLLVVLFFMTACPGLKFLRWAGIDKRDTLETFVLSSASGFAIMAEVLLVVGMLGFFSPGVICFILIALFAVSAREAGFFLTALVRGIRSVRFSLTMCHVVGATFAVFVAINILKALLPPHGPTDVLYYHLTIPKLYLTHGAVVTHPTLWPSFFPSNGEVLFVLSLILGGPVFVNLTVLGFGLLTVMALYAYAQKYVRKEYALIPGIIYLTTPVVNSWGTMAYTDNVLGLYLFLLCMLMIEYDRETGLKQTLVAGLMAGMALGTKYQAMALVGMIFGGLFLLRLKSWRQMLPLFVASLTLAVALAAPWYVRNMVLTGNPVYPLLRDVFTSAMLDQDSTFFTPLESKEILRGAIRNIAGCYFLPFSYLIAGAMPSDDFQRYLGPLFLGVVPFIFVVRRSVVKWPCIALVALLSYLSVGFLAGNMRYVILLLILLSLLGGGGVQEVLFRTRRSGQFVVTGFLALVLLYYSYENYSLKLSHNRIRAALDPQFTVSFLRAGEMSWRPAEWANENLPNDAKVLFHGTVRYYYFKFEPFNDYIGQRVIVYDEAKNGSDLLEVMRKHGFTHIICLDVIPEIAYPHTIRYDQDPRFIEFGRTYLKKLFSANGMSIYRIEYPLVSGLAEGLQDGYVRRNADPATERSVALRGRYAA